MSRAGARRAAALAIWAVAVGAALGVLHLAGRGPLAAPPLRSPSVWGSWVTERDPVVAAFALVRLFALGGAWYVAAVSVIGGAARLASRPRVAAAVDRLTVPPLRRALPALLSVGLGAGALSPGVAAADQRQPPATVDARAPSSPEGAPPPTVVMRRLPPPAHSSPTTTPATPEPPRPAASRTWTVQPGECFWSIAEAVVGEALGRHPEAEEVAPYWRRLVEANRSALADRANPDLVFPGQVFTVPEP